MRPDPNCPHCKVEMNHVPDNILWHYVCPKCEKEFELDGETEICP